MLRAPTGPPDPAISKAGSAQRVVAWARRLSRRTRIALGVVSFVPVLGALAFGPLVRSRVTNEASRRRLDITIGSVSPGFLAVTLHDVRVRLANVPGVELQLEDARVELSVGLSVREVVARGGEIRLEGEPEDVIERLRTFRRGSREVSASSETSSKIALSVEGLSLAWKVPSGGELSGNGIFAKRDAAATKLGCGRCKAAHHHVAAELVGAEIELAPDGAPRRVTATSLAISHEPPRTAAQARSVAAPAVEPPPPPLPVATRGKGAKATQAKGATPTPATIAVPEEPLLPLPDLHSLRARIQVLATTAGARIPDGMVIEVGGLSVKLDVGGEPVAVGPGKLALSRTADRIHVTFSSEADEPARAVGTPLAIDADLPVGAGDVTARLSGGPVSLAALGVKEGTKGLFDVARGTVAGKGQLVLASNGDALTFDGQVQLKSIAIKHPRVAADPLRGIDFAVSARGVLDDLGRLRVDDAQLDLGALHVKTHGTVEETKEHLGLSLAIDVAPAACQALLDGLPQGLLPTVRTARMGGTFGATARVVFDTRAIDKLALEYDIDDRCKAVDVPRDLAHERFTSSFTYRTYHPDGTSAETTTGPGTPTWTDLDDISPYMMVALLTTEDGAFYKHHGFNHYAIRSSIQANLKARSFVRGASTITMQLAKNLFLARDKTLSRKIEEVVLTDYLEQAFRKDDMMELYLNVVEFGPDVYGVTQAAEYYFGRKPEELNVAECFFLASLLPSPVRYGKQREKGQASDAWMRHVHALIEIAGRNGKLTVAEVDGSLTQELKFVRPGDPRPDPRKPSTSARRDARGDDVGWQPLE